MATRSRVLNGPCHGRGRCGTPRDQLHSSTTKLPPGSWLPHSRHCRMPAPRSGVLKFQRKVYTSRFMHSGVSGLWNRQSHTPYAVPRRICGKRASSASLFAVQGSSHLLMRRRSNGPLQSSTSSGLKHDNIHTYKPEPWKSWNAEAAQHQRSSFVKSSRPQRQMDAGMTF